MKTTREEAIEENRENLVDSLQSLLEKNYDAEKGFKNAITNVKDENLKSYLKNQAVVRNRFATELDRELHNLNEKPKQSGSVAGSFHRTWMDLKSSIAGNYEEAVLEECIRGDKASEDEYNTILSENHFPPQIENVLNNHLTEIKQTLSQTKTLENLADRNNI